MKQKRHMDQSILPNKLKIVLKSQKGSKDMYNILNHNNQIGLRCEEKWDQLLNKNYSWKAIHSQMKYSTKNSKLQWLQYRIIHRILGTNQFLHKIGIKESDKCDFCGEETETIEHLFW